MIRRALFTLAACAAAAVAFAQSSPVIVATWELPTEREDGTALPASAIESVELECLGATSLPGTATEYTAAVTLVAGQSYTCSVHVVDAGGRPSPAAVIAFTAPSTAAPGPVRQFRLRIELEGVILLEQLAE